MADSRRSAVRLAIGALAPLIGGMVAVGSGCSVDEHAFYIYQNQVPGGTCQVDTSEETYQPSGTLDVSVSPPRGYVLYPLIKFEFPTNVEEGLPERNIFDLREFRINLDVSRAAPAGSLPPQLLSFTEYTSGTMKPSGIRASKVTIIPDDLAAAIAVPANRELPVVAEVQIVAVRLGTSSEIISAPFYYQVELCNGCLVQRLSQCPNSEDAAAQALIDATNNVCGQPQDLPLVCCPGTAGADQCFAASGN